MRALKDGVSPWKASLAKDFHFRFEDVDVWPNRNLDPKMVAVLLVSLEPT